MTTDNPKNEIDLPQTTDEQLKAEYAKEVADDEVYKGGLNARQRRFCQEYIIDLNETKSAERAGYSIRTAAQQGCRLLRNVKIQEYVQECMNLRTRRTAVTADYVIGNLTRMINRCLQGEPVVNKKGEQVWAEGPNGQIAPIWEFDSKGAAKGLELLGKHLKILTDVHEIKDQTKRVALSDLPKEPDKAKQFLDDVKAGRIELVES